MAKFTTYWPDICHMTICHLTWLVLSLKIPFFPTPHSLPLNPLEILPGTTLWIQDTIQQSELHYIYYGKFKKTL